MKTTKLLENSFRCINRRNMSVYQLFYYPRSHRISTLHIAHTVSPRPIRFSSYCDLGYLLLSLRFQ